MRLIEIICCSFTLILLCSYSSTEAQLLNDYNGDGVVSVTSFGDSITYGVGDAGSGFGDTAEYPNGPAGYPTKLAALLNIPVRNAGVPGEFLIDSGFERWPGIVQGSPSDIVLLLEGTNDVTVQASQTEYRRSIQQMINVAIAADRLPVLMTLPPPCCNKLERRPPSRSYSDIIKDRAAVNELPLIDIEKLWDNNCPSASSCDLYVQPEGLHPSSRGYTAMAQTISARLLDIDIFAPDGPQRLEEALALPAGSVIVIPDAVESKELPQ